MSTYKPGLNRKLHRYFDLNDKMMRLTDPAWLNGDDGKGDALWRTGLAYITWQKVEMKEGVLDCFRKYDLQEGKYGYQVMRHTGRFMEDDVSRDQTILALSSLAVNNDKEELEEIGASLPYRLSRKFYQTPSMWFWVQNLRGKMWGAYLFCFLTIFEMLLSIGLNKIIEPILGLKGEMPQEDYKSSSLYKEKSKKWNKFQKLLDKAMWPCYAQHLNCWQIYTCSDNFLKTILEKLLLLYTEKGNLLFRLLLRDEVSIEEIDAYKPMTGWRWNIRLDGSGKSHVIIPTGKKASMLSHNQLDKDVLYTLKKLV